MLPVLMTMESLEKPRYQDNEEHLLSSEDSSSHAEYRREPSSLRRYVLFAFILLTTNLTTFAATARLFTQSSCLATLPGAGDAVIKPLAEPSVLRFTSTIHHTSKYRANASSEVDAAWLSLGTDYQYAVLSPSEAAAASISLEHVSLPANSFRNEAGQNVTGGGYLGNVEVMHQLHCLNLVRKSLWFNADYYKALGKGPFKDPESMLIMHVGHCLDMLREKLMCDADTGFVPYYWLGSKGRTVPDFEREHTCADFDGVRAWAGARQRWLADGVKMPGPGEDGFSLDTLP